jgi:ABC-type multidrug transport system ATPase subunit
VFGDRAGVSRAEALSGLGDRLAHLASTYSVGMRRRLAFSALAPGEARLLVLDEPFAGIDHEARERLRDWLRTSLENGCGVLVAAHAQDIDALASLPVRELDLSR